MSAWQDFYDSGEFGICTTEPSPLVVEFADTIPPASEVADVGCGAGRHALYLASLGHKVHASDIVDLGWYAEVDESLRERIDFQVASVDDIVLGEAALGAVVAMRFLQYLAPEQLERLARKTGTALQAGGLMVASYVVSGGVDKSHFGVAEFRHDPTEVAGRLTDEGLTITAQRQFQTVSRYLPYHSEVEVCELVARKAA